MTGQSEMKASHWQTRCAPARGEDVDSVADVAGLKVVEQWREHSRWFAALTCPDSRSAA